MNYAKHIVNFLTRGVPPINNTHPSQKKRKELCLDKLAVLGKAGLTFLINVVNLI